MSGHMNEMAKLLSPGKKKIVAFLILSALVLAALFYVCFPELVLLALGIGPDSQLYERLPDSEKRRIDHAMVRHYYAAHDGCLGLRVHGDHSSIPILIDALGRARDDGEFGSANEVVVCTWGHCAEALETLTGKSFGLDVDAWRDWWDAEGKNSSPDRALP